MSFEASAKKDNSVQSAPPRYHHLDALRAGAMLLGIVLHALLSFFEISIWPAQDVNQHEHYGTAQYAIHGFRMPLFFLISGYFTTMLWRRRGLAQLVLHRLKRILLPLALGWVAFVPLTIAVSVIGEHTKISTAPANAELWIAVREGNHELLRSHLENGVSPNAKDENSLSLLAWSVLTGHEDCVTLLLENGADSNAPDATGNTPLHGAAFLGRNEITVLLIDHGAHVNTTSWEGKSPLDSARDHWAVVETVTGWLKIEVDRKEVMSGREDVIATLRERGATAQGSFLIQIYKIGAMIPFFMHLWFLYYILWLVALFALASWICTRLSCKPLPGWLLRAPVCWIVLVPLTAFAQYFMTQSFGPDTAMGPLPWPPKLFYYGLFFGFGALSFGRTVFEEKAGRWWPLHFLLAIPVFHYSYGLYLDKPIDLPNYRLSLSLSAALYCWLMVYGFLGFFRQFFRTEDKRVRYLSDATYWMYLAHLPLVIGLQIIVMPWPLPSFLKFTAICVVTFAIMLLSYRYLVRYTWIGTILNGKKVKSPPLPPPSPTSA